MRRIDILLSKKPRSAILTTAMLLVLLVGTADWLTGSDISLSLFYIGPIALAAWYAGFAEGIFVAVGCGLVWLIADMGGDTPPRYFWIPYSNAAIRTAVFGIVAWLLSRTKQLAAGLEIKVKQRTAQLEREIADRELAEIQLRESEGRFRQLTESITQVFWMTNSDKSQMLYISPGYERIWGRTCDSLYRSPKAWLEAIHPDDRKRIQEAALTQQSLGTFDEEYCIQRPDGTVRWIRDRAFPIYDGTGMVYRIAGIAEDITERKELEREILEISDREQARIGQDLHDGLCQELVGIAFSANLLVRKLTKEGSSHVEAAEEIARQLDGAITQCRNASRGLYPVKMDATGLTSAFEELSSMVAKRFLIECTFEQPDAVVLKDNVINTHLYRIAQEAVINAIKHGKARQIRIVLSSIGNAAKLTVTDDGIGLPKRKTLHSGLGLHIMQYRARLIGGSLELRRRQSGGTLVECSFHQNAALLEESHDGQEETRVQFSKESSHPAGG